MLARRFDVAKDTGHHTETARQRAVAIPDFFQSARTVPLSRAEIDMANDFLVETLVQCMLPASFVDSTSFIKFCKVLSRGGFAPHGRDWFTNAVDDRYDMEREKVGEAVKMWSTISRKYSINNCMIDDKRDT